MTMRAPLVPTVPALNPLANPHTFWTAAAITGAIVVVRAAFAANGQPCGLGCSLAVAGADGMSAAVVGGITAGAGAIAKSGKVADAGLGILAAGAAAWVLGWGGLWLSAMRNPSSVP
jgi:hypothetical protein